MEHTPKHKQPDDVGEKHQPAISASNSPGVDIDSLDAVVTAIAQGLLQLAYERLILPSPEEIR